MADRAPPGQGGHGSRRRRTGLRGQDDFRRLWVGDSISQLGSAVSEIALPLVALYTVHASTFQVGVLRALEALPFLAVGLPAGAWVDRMRRRRVLVATDLARAAALASIPLVDALGVLSVAQLLAVALMTGIGTVFFEVAYQSYLPEIVEPARLVEGNTALQSSASVARVVGPPMGGLLVSAITAPYAVAVDAASFLWSAAWVGAIRTRPGKQARAPGRSLRHDISDGISFVLRHKLLRAITLTTAMSNLVSSATMVMVLVLLVRTLALPPGLVGVSYSAGAVGGLLGALVARRVALLIGEGRALCVAVLTAQLVMLVQPFVHRGWSFWVLIVALFVEGVGIVVYNVIQVSFRQGLCPPELRGRMNATIRFLVTGTTSLGGLLGGLLGASIGVRPGLLVATLVGLLAIVPVAASPLRRAGRLDDLSP